MFKKIIASFLMFILLGIKPCFAYNWVTITSENGKTADLDLDSVVVVLDAVEYNIKTKVNDFDIVQRLSTELYKENSPTAVIEIKKYSGGELVDSQRIVDRNYRLLKQGTLHAEIFEVLSKELQEKEFRKGHSEWDKYLKKQRKDIYKKWKPRKFSEYNKNYVMKSQYVQPIYLNTVDLELDKSGNVMTRTAEDSEEKLFQVIKLEPVPQEYTNKTFNLSVNMKYYKYVGAKMYNKGVQTAKISPVKAEITVAKNSRPPVFGHIQYGLLRFSDSISHFFNNNNFENTPLIIIPVLIVVGVFLGATWIFSNLLFLLFGGDVNDV